MKATAFEILRPVSVTNGASGGVVYGAPVDVAAAYCRVGKIIMTSKSSAGSSPTLAAKMQKSDPLTLTHSKVYASGDTEIDQKSNNDTATNVRVAAKFTVATGGKTVSKIYLPLKKVGAPTGDITVVIKGDTTGDPNATVYATFPVVAAASLTTSYVETGFTLATPVDLAAGTYWIELTSAVTPSTSVYIAWKALDVDSLGNANLYDTGYTPTATVDLLFRLYAYQFTDVTSGGFTGLTTVGSVQSVDVDWQTLSVIRPYFTVGGTSTPAFYTGIVGVAETAQS